MVRRGVIASILAAMLLAAPSATASPGDPIPTWAYYYIWFDVSSWNRAKVDYPLLGRYSSDETSVMRSHIRLAKQAGIDGFIVSWKSTPVLNRRLRMLAGVAAQEHFRLAIIYQGLDFHRRPQPVSRIAGDLREFTRTFARLPALRGASKPTVIWSGTWEFSARQLRSVTAPLRRHLRILASERNARDYLAKSAAFDGDAYYWSSVNPDTYPGVTRKLRQIARAVHSTGGQWFAPAAPGFDGNLVGHSTIVPRHNGATFRRELRSALASDPDALAVISWNEFSENSHIEPSRRYGTRALEVLADVHGTKLHIVGELDSSQPASAHPRGLDGLTAVLVFIGLGLATVYVLARRRRRRAVR
jgi:Glycosyl hydrolase family 99